jgi:hypothetical protein
MKKPRTKNDFLNHPFVSDIWKEGEDGWWVDLKKGYQCDETHSIHQATIKDLAEAFLEVEPCDCDKCRS